MLAGLAILYAVAGWYPAGLSPATGAEAEATGRDGRPSTEQLAIEAVRRLEVYPEKVVLVGRDSRQQLLATALVDGPDGGQQRDATRTASYRVAQPGIAAVGPGGVVRPLGSGSTQIEVTLGGQRVTVAVEVGHGESYLPLDFRRDIVPLLTKGGCNGGGCHGKSGGRGGFQLSLFGFDPRGDHESIVRCSRGRRLFPASPEQSLLVAKPRGALPHGGGVRLEAGGEHYERLVRWIADGAAWGDEATPQLERVEIAPTFRALGRDCRQQVVVTAVYADGSRRDVTTTTELRSNDTAVATVDDSGLVATLARTGETAIVAIHHGHVAVSRIMVPLELRGAGEDGPSQRDDVEAALARFSPVNYVDELVLARLRQLGIPPSEQSSDEGFVRRASLQITGRLPTPDEVARFAAETDGDKRGALVERLLSSGGYADHFAQKWADILRNKRRGQNDRLPGTIGFYRWIRNALAVNMPYDRFVEEILTATGSPSVNPKAQWYHEVRELEQCVDDTAQVFLGVRIACARCHHHPFEKFSQDDWYGLAAFFARLQRKGGSGVAERRAGETIVLAPTGDVRHPITGAVVQPHGLGADGVEVPAYEDPRRRLVEWLRRPDNPYFARAFVNRLWAHFFGRGLVEPHDDLRVTNPATNEPLLEALAADFVDSGYDMKHVVRTICTSRVYQLSSEANAYNVDDALSHARFYPQRLKAEVLLDAIDQVSGAATSYSGLPAGTRATQLPDEGYSNTFLNLFGRPPRESACECEREAAPSLSQALFLMNDGFVQGKLSAGGGLAARLAKDPRPHAERVGEMFLAALCRRPDADELRRAVEYLEAEKDAAAGYRNLLWAVMNTKEFLYVH